MSGAADPCLFVVVYVIYFGLTGVYNSAVRAMKRVGEIRERRQAQFIKNRSVYAL